MTSEILINQMFAGSYLEEGHNIGHEIINLFRADDGEHYLYVTPSGRMSAEHNVDAIIFVRNVSARKTMEVLSVAVGLTRVTNEAASSVEYAGLSVSQIFRESTYHGDADPFEQIITYRAENVRVPKDGSCVVLTVDDRCKDAEAIRIVTKKKVLVSQSLRGYYPQSEESYSPLNQLISDKKLWKNASSGTALVPSKHDIYKQRSYLEIIGKEDDELVFSNLLAYYLEYDRTAFQRFAEEGSILGIEDMDYDFEIIRESNHNIDLWIESEHHVIVIENKIKSGINGVKNNDYSQLNKYYELATEYANSVGKQARFCIFAPDYNSLDLSQYGVEGIYKVIRYSALYDHFVCNATAFLDDKYFPEFLNGLKRHSLTLAEHNLSIMRTRFMEKIWQAQ